ncbi:SDR family NAD(P)-dependent oxidoreductase [Sphingobium fluviale]|uniref:SDR family oxidoreductase n=1 Tax=Sphingobium fluviale TaxID=2506423 RepID=A0A4Q1KDR8_9SPHN|nr:SDR family oxidoreductase [Sphingobium fluviale]RXR24719.1 SDR family oxidoreductase [Sphingobium fluviale]
MEKGRLSGKTAIVSAGGAGIGQAIAVRFAKEGAKVIIGDIGDMDKTLELCAAVGMDATAAYCDVSDPDSVDGFRSFVHDAGLRCDILMNVAGIYPDHRFDDMTFEIWRRVLAVNLDSMFLMAKAFAPDMQEKGAGRIINIASCSVNIAVPGVVHYITSKGGVIAFTRALATDLGMYGINVNAIAPGYTRTPGTLEHRVLPDGSTSEQRFDFLMNMQTIKRTEEPADIVGTASFLAGPDSAFITGQTIYVDGGMTRTT